MYSYKYSRKEGTREAERLDQIPDNWKAKRSNVLLEMNKKQSDYFRELVSKTELNVLMEEQKEIDGITYQIGHTKEYVKVALPVLEDLSNQILKVKGSGEFITHQNEKVLVVKRMD